MKVLVFELNSFHLEVLPTYPALMPSLFGDRLDDHIFNVWDNRCTGGHLNRELVGPYRRAVDQDGDTYGHLVPGGNKEAVDKLDGLEDATNRNLSATTASNRVSKKR